MDARREQESLRNLWRYIAMRDAVDTTDVSMTKAEKIARILYEGIKRKEKEVEKRTATAVDFRRKRSGNVRVSDKEK